MSIPKVLKPILQKCINFDPFKRPKIQELQECEWILVFIVILLKHLE